MERWGLKWGMGVPQSPAWLTGQKVLRAGRADLHDTG
jgi:hypothetical protein